MRMAICWAVAAAVVAAAVVAVAVAVLAVIQMPRWPGFRPVFLGASVLCATRGVQVLLSVSIGAQNQIPVPTWDEPALGSPV